jgi:capsular exopolysaccharide synthesis family protein
MSQAGSRVLAVDADFRHPTLHKAIDGSIRQKSPPPGLSDLIIGAAGLPEVVLRTPFSRLAILPAGPVPANPGEVLGSGRMRAVIEELAKEADYVLLDSPPCLQYAEAYLLSNMVDGVLYVIRAGSQDAAAQRRVQRQLQQAKARLLGVVFNDAEPAYEGGDLPYTRRRTRED